MITRILLSQFGIIAAGTAILITSACKEKGEVHHFRIEAPYHWTLPADWSAESASGMRLATITIPQEEGDSLEASISEFGGSLAGNINRWRGQIGLNPVPEAEILPSLEKIETKLGPAYIALLINPESTDKAMLAAVIPRPSSRAVFIKVTDSADRLKGIAEPFRTFTQSFTK